MLQITIIFQQAAGDAAGAAGAPSTMEWIFQQLIFIVPLIAIFYFLLIRPQNQRMKKHREMLAAMKKGDTIVTNGGIVGRILKLSDEEVTIDTLEGGKLRVVRSMVMDVRTKGEPTPANDTKES
jgi:preprotein translocase subunit YajC